MKKFKWHNQFFPPLCPKAQIQNKTLGSDLRYQFVCCFKSINGKQTFQRLKTTAVIPSAVKKPVLFPPTINLICR